jgi:hypothetical protein
MRFGTKLSITQIREFTETIQSARATERPLTMDEEKFLDWLLVRVGQWPADVLDFMGRLAAQVGKLDFATEAARTLMLADVSEYPLMTPDHRQRAKERLYKALTHKPPEEGQEAKRARQRTQVSGHDFERPARFGR